MQRLSSRIQRPRKLREILYAALLYHVLAGTCLAQQPADHDLILPPSSDKVLIEARAEDSAIDARLSRILEASGWFENSQVEVREGIVFLDGSAATQEHKEWAALVAEKTQDVVAVVNRIEVTPQVSWDFSPAWEETNRLALKAQQAFPLVVMGLFILIATWWLAKLASCFARWMLQDRIASPLMRMVTARAIALPIFILGLYLILQISGLTQLALTVLGGTGLLGIALGFAFRDIAENFLASLLLSIRNPFHAGDLIRLGEHEGIVKNLNTRSTVLVTTDGNHIQIPNATVFKSVITNYSTNSSRRDSFIVGIGYDDSTGKAQSIIEGILTSHPAVRDEPGPFVVVEQLAASTVNLKAYFWFDSATHSTVKLKSALMRQAKAALLDAGISMPDEAREVIFPEGLPLYRKSLEEKKESSKKPRKNAEPPEVNSSSAEGGLDSEADELLKETGSAASPDEQENLLRNPSTGF